MGAKIYTTTAQAWEEASTPKVYSGGVFTDSDGMLYNQSASAFEDVAWSAEPPESKWVALVPTMTSNTTPSGEAFANSEFSSGYGAYCAFASTSFWSTKSGTKTNSYVGYTFTENVTVKKVTVQGRTDANVIKDFKIEYYKDGNWYEATPILCYDISSSPNVIYITNSIKSSKWRLFVIDNNTSKESAQINVIRLQFYGY